MTTSIGHRWKGGNVRSRVVLIARWLAQTPSRGRPRDATNLFFQVHRFLVVYLIQVRPIRPPCPIIMSKPLRPSQMGVEYGSALRYSFGPPFGGQGASFRWPWRRGPPLTIPNREVKPVCADGTATPSGRVGRRLFLESPHRKMWGLFFCTGSKCGSRMGRWRAQGRETLQSGSLLHFYIGPLVY